MHRNLAASRRPPRPAARRRRRPPTGSGLRSAGSTQRAWCTTPKVVLLSCAALAWLAYYRSTPSSSGPTPGPGKGNGGGNNGAGGSSFSTAGVGGDGNGIEPWRGVDGLLGGNGTAAGDDRERWKQRAGWGDLPLSDLEEWAPLGPDPQGCLPRTSVRPEAQRQVLVGWGFGSPKLTLYTYRALESILHVYPGAHVKFITIGPRYAYFYKWANIIALTQFQKYSKRGYDVKVEIYFGKMQGATVMKGWPIPGHQWWKRNQDTLLYGNGLPIATFQTTQDAVPDAYVTIFLALLELYKHGGIYVDLTTFFVRPLPADLDGFVAGGQGQGPGGAAAPGFDCSTPTTGGRRQRPFVMQYHAPQHPVVACVLGEYDQEVSALNECIIVLTGGSGAGGMDCVLKALERCTVKSRLSNDLRLAGVVEWHGCSEETAEDYAKASRTGVSGSDKLEAIAGIPPRPLPPRAPSRDDGDGGDVGSSTADVIKGLLSRPGAGEEGESSTPEEAKDLLSPSSSGGDDDGDGEEDGGGGGGGGGRSASRNTGEDTASGGENGEDSADADDDGGASSETQHQTGEEEGEEEGEGGGERQGGGIPDQLAGSATETDDGDDVIHKRTREGQTVEVEVEVETRDTETEKSEQEQEAADAKLAASETNDDDDSGSGFGSGGGGGQGGDGDKPAPVAREDFLDVLADAGIGGGEEALEGLEERSEDDAEEGYEGGEEGGLKEPGSGGGAAVGDGEEEGGEGDGGDVVGSRASVSSSTADAAFKEERRQATRRRKLAAGDAGAGAGITKRETVEKARGGGGSSSSSGAAARNREGGDGRSPQASRALVAGGGEAQGSFAPATPDGVSLLWMGPQATDGLWREPAEDSLWAEVFSRLRLTRWKPQQVSASCRIPCGHWDTLSPEGSKASEADKTQAGFQCAPTVFVPGTQKGASTFLFHAISWHPQMVQPLRGAHGFKETGRYSPEIAVGPERLGLRLAAFPYIEEHENFATGDGSVIYMLHSMKTPKAILADNPHAKIVFALRDPVARAWSDFRFLWGVYKKQEGFPSVIDMSLDSIRRCFEGHMGEDPQPFDFGDGGPGQLTIPEEEEEAILHFFSRCSTVQDPGQIVRKGIYYYQVLHWMRVFGRDNIMIVDSADLKSRQKETIEEVYRFLGLCPADISKLEPENVTQSPNIPDHMKITQESFKALQDFYEPFNKKLYKLLGRDLGWEKNTFKARRR